MLFCVRQELFFKCVSSGFAAKWRRTALFCLYYGASGGNYLRRFGTNSQSHLQCSRFFSNPEDETRRFLNTKDGNDRLYRNVCNELPPLATQYLRIAQFSVPLNVFPRSRPKSLPSKRHSLCSMTMNKFPVR